MSAALCPDDPYAILGVGRAATTKEIRHAYRVLSKKLHPDKDRSVPAATATARFQKVKAAYELLSDPARRQALDSKVVTAPPRPRSAASPGLGKFAQRATKRQAESKSQHNLRRARGAFDYEDEEADREAEWEAAEAVRGEYARRRVQRAAEQRRRMAEKESLRQTKKSKAQKVKSAAVSAANESNPEAPKSKGKDQSVSAVVILDSDEEEAQEEERQELEAVRRKHSRQRVRLATENARQMAEQEMNQAQPHRTTSGGDLSDVRFSYVRLTFRCPLKQGESIPSADELATAFAEFDARVVSVTSEVAVLAVASQDNAMGCALAFHGWTKKVYAEGQKRVLRTIRIVTAPVTATGRAMSGPRATVAATQSRVVACDHEGPKFV